MEPQVHAAALAGLAILSYGLARFPRALFAEAGGGVQPSVRLEWIIAGALLVIAVAAFELLVNLEPIARLVAAGALTTFAAIIQADVRFLVIPDVYNIALVLAALAGPISLDLFQIGMGAVFCGGLLALIAWMWKTAHRGRGTGLWRRQARRPR